MLEVCESPKAACIVYACVCLCMLVYACVCLCMFVYGLLALQGFCVILALTDVCISDIDTCEFAKQKLWQRWYVGDIHIDSRESFLKRQR